MEVMGAGNCTTQVAGKQQVSSKDGKLGSFANLMNTVLNKATPVNVLPVEQTGNEAVALTELAQYLNTVDLSELEEGLQLLNSLSSDTANLLEEALSYFGLEVEDLKVMVEKWTELNGAEKMPEEDLLSSLASLMMTLSALPQSELASKLDRNDVLVIKSIKLYDLVLKYSDAHQTENTVQLKAGLQDLGDKLARQTPDKTMLDYVHTRFTRLVAEINLANSNNHSEAENSSEGPPLKIDGPAGVQAFLPQMTKAEQLTLMLNSPERPVSAEELMKQFEAILAKSQFSNSGGTQKLTIKLFPEHLGSVRVELFQKDQTIIARIITTTGVAKDTLDSQLTSLKQAFAAQNISVERIEILQQTAQQERFLNRDSQQQQRQPDSQGQKKKEEKDTFTLSFEEALLNTEA